MRRVAAALVAASVTLGVAAASASPPPADDKAAEAERLFEEGKRMIAAKDVAQACHAFEESQKLDPAVGTQFNVADCYERQGKLATAYRQFVDLRDVLVRVGDERSSQADARAKALEPRLPRIVVRVPWQAQVSGLVVTANERALSPRELERALAVDPGPQTIHVEATNKKPFTTTVDVGEGKTQTIDVPPLPDDRQVVVRSTGVSQKNVGLMVGGVGVAALGTSVLLGLIGKKNYDAAVAGCTDTGTELKCPPGDKSGNAASAQSLGGVATIVGVVGAVAIAAGAVLFLTSPKAPPSPGKSAALRLVPALGPGGGGVLLDGAL